MESVQKTLLRQVEIINETYENNEIEGEFKKVALKHMKKKLNELTEELIANVDK